MYYFSCWVDLFGSVPFMCCEQAFTLFGYRKRRKDKDVTSSPGGSGSPTGVNAEVDSRPYLDDDFTQERIIDVDLLPLVLPPYGVDYNEWLATHSTSTDICVELDLKTSGQRILSKGRIAGRRIEFVLRHHCCSSAATLRRHCFSHRTLHHSVRRCDRL